MDKTIESLEPLSEGDPVYLPNNWEERMELIPRHSPTTGVVLGLGLSIFFWVFAYILWRLLT